VNSDKNMPPREAANGMFEQVGLPVALFSNSSHQVLETFSRSQKAEAQSQY
jgi:hypothetical protein